MNITTLMGGLQAGAIINLLFAISVDMMFYSMMNWFIGTTVIIVDLIVNAIFGGIIGAIIALMLGRGGTKAAA